MRNDDDFAGTIVAAMLFAALFCVVVYLGMTMDDIGQFH